MSVVLLLIDETCTFVTSQHAWFNILLCTFTAAFVYIFAQMGIPQYLQEAVGQRILLQAPGTAAGLLLLPLLE